LNAASNLLRDLVISVLHRLRQSRTLHTLTSGPISGVHFSYRVGQDVEIPVTASVKKGTTQISFRLYDEKAEAAKAVARNGADHSAAK
jgi:hypothetical protein